MSAFLSGFSDRIGNGWQGSGSAVNKVRWLGLAGNDGVVEHAYNSFWRTTLGPCDRPRLAEYLLML